MKKIIIAPSILSANFATLERDINIVEKAGAKWIHIDVIDGHFAPNITLGPAIVKALRKTTKLFFDIHLMITGPEKYWQDFQKAGANLITFHSEVQIDKRKLIENIKTSGIKAGISIKPKTPVSDIEDLLSCLDLVLVMTVEPGFSGQLFMSDMIPKIETLRKNIDRNNYNCLIEIDGGINSQTSSICIQAGADALVSGSYIFSAENPAEAIKSLSL
ncbi:MAG: ribulose-phosphate 3-epimerase [Endomicrobium sp.]|jgi:ribulose-phosphate 3-epimerase|nr:ribulose-phosphate 3-epimerase [Endomicrobium sp.]